jgi:hypothetical protein
MPKRGRNRTPEPEYGPEDLDDFEYCTKKVGSPCTGLHSEVACAGAMAKDGCTIKIPGVGCGRIPKEE